MEAVDKRVGPACVRRLRGRRGLPMLAILLVLPLCAFGQAAPRPAGPVEGTRYLDLLDMHAAPRSATDRSFNIFFDAGSWQGYSLPRSGDTTTGFVGPFVGTLAQGRWAGARFARLSLSDIEGKPITLHAFVGHSAPGYLTRLFDASGLRVRETLFFAIASTAMVRIDLTASKATDVRLAISGQMMPSSGSVLAERAGNIVSTFPGTNSSLTTRTHPSGKIAISGQGYTITLQKPLHLDGGSTATVYVVQTLIASARETLPVHVDFAAAWQRDRERWDGYLKVAARAHLDGLSDEVARRVVVKAMETLLGNWRAPYRGLRHAGVVPSYSNPDFENGFWSWDSWKQAAALALFAPRLAEDNVRALFDYQVADGMVPDVIYPDKADDNWRDTKPPLATWAVLKIYAATGDKRFLAEMYDKLARYHRWWFSNRDHAHDGLAEYGSTDGTRIAAKWESGMDDAARFDDITMLKNGPHAWSMNQEAVDLNAYLYQDAMGLAQIAGDLGNADAQRRWSERAAAMKAKIQQCFFDKKLGYFFDVELPGHGFVKTFGPEGWIPLWTGAATQEQANAVARVLRDPRKFDTFMPFPTLAADDPRFAPVTGYWRGPVWLDQAYFGVAGLWRYGFNVEADNMALRLVRNAKGLAGQAPIYENYDPLTGNGQNSRNFSWSAASYILLLLQPHGHGESAAHPRVAH